MKNRTLFIMLLLSVLWQINFAQNCADIPVSFNVVDPLSTAPPPDQNHCYFICSDLIGDFSGSWIFEDADPNSQNFPPQNAVGPNAIFENFEFGLYRITHNYVENGTPMSECLELSPCDLCTAPNSVLIEYNDCSVTEGCNVELRASFAAQNGLCIAEDVKVELYFTEMEFGEEPPASPPSGDPIQTNLGFASFDPDKGEIVCSADVQTGYSRSGCYQVRFLFDIIKPIRDNCGPIEIWSKPFKCIAPCIYEDGGAVSPCAASILANEMMEESGTCELIVCCTTSGLEISTPENPSPCQDGLRKNSSSVDLTNSVTENYLSLIISPNPSSSNISIELVSPVTDHGVLKIISTGGQIVFEQKMSLEKQTSSTHSLNVEHWPAGIYNVEFNGKQQQIAKRLIVN